MDFDFMRNIFYDWTTGGVVTWLVLSLGIIYASWFMKIPSITGGDAGMPFIVKVGLTVFIPVVSWYMINNKDWTADKFRNLGSRRRR